MWFSASLLLAVLPAAFAQSPSLQTSLTASLAKHPSLSAFHDLLVSSPSLIYAILDGKSSNVTLLAPTNDALAVFASKSKVSSIASLPAVRLQTILKYHVLDTQLQSHDFAAAPRGLTVPTVLRDPQYNNRSAGVQLKDLYGATATGQVLFIDRDPIPSVSGQVKRFSVRVRQAVAGSEAHLRAGLAQTAKLTAVDGLWDGGSLQIVDTVLSPPMPCSTTIRSTQAILSALDNALNRSGLYPALDSSPNVTCLAPSTAAFTTAGNPDASLEPGPLGSALLFHTLPEVTYTNFLQDGQVFTSLANLTVTVRILQDSIYFNDAKVVSPNVLTNNGLIHILDRVMSPNGTPPELPDATGTSGGPAPTSSTSPNGVASRYGGAAGVGVAAVLMAAALL